MMESMRKREINTLKKLTQADNIAREKLFRVRKDKP
jgi:hypothetical protein